ncbi:MAG: 3-hydroxyacyl-CoA dehydrogenase family protein [Gemmatimonadetes bacterium]|nr:3-hydroxyacyl-CoA dehydrogenase family protein [Gemmatimonadota bacterium]
MSERVAVLGAGTMGHGIAQVAAQSGFETILFDVTEDLAGRGAERVLANLEAGVKRGKVTPEARDATLSRLTTSHDLAAAVAGCALVVEAAPERIDVKRQIFETISAAAPDTAILATNTSSLSVTEIAACAKGPERVVGMHFFNPPYVLKLLEIVRAQQTSDATVEKVRAIGERLGREMIVVSDSPGFATSRLGLVIGLEAMRMLQEGVGSVLDIDRAMELGYRHPMGPLALTDLVGLDVRLDIAEYLHRELGGEQFRAPTILRKLVRAGKLGRKTGEGFYRWDASGVREPAL